MSASAIRSIVPPLEVFSVNDWALLFTETTSPVACCGRVNAPGFLAVGTVSRGLLGPGSTAKLGLISARMASVPIASPVLVLMLNRLLCGLRTLHPAFRRRH